MEERYLLARVHVTDDYAADMANFVLIPPESIELALKYSQQICIMKDNGLRPFRISQFFYGSYWTERLPRFTREFTEKVYLVGGTRETLESCYDPYDNDVETVNTIDEFIDWIERKNEYIRIDCESIECDEKDFFVSCHGKYCGTRMESESFYFTDSPKPMENWFDGSVVEEDA